MNHERYTRRRPVGTGGASRVWLGHDTLLDRPVALKELGRTLGDDRDDDRAEREARLTAQVKHPHVVVVYDVVDHGGSQWLVMEHVEGTTLGQACLPRGLAPERAARLLAPVADALATSHDAGVVHRDVKPSNILVGDDDIAKLSDFGVARRQDDVALTRTGLITGSPGYVAPEVALGRPASAASDVWAFGATLYHACTGEPAYPLSDDPIESLEHIVRDDAPILPADHPLAAVVATTMAREPSDRPTMAEVAGELERLRRPRPVETERPLAAAQEPDGSRPATPAREDRDSVPPRRRGGSHAAPRRRQRAWLALTSFSGAAADEVVEEAEQIAADAAPDLRPDITPRRSGDGQQTAG